MGVNKLIPKLIKLDYSNFDKLAFSANFDPSAPVFEVFLIVVSQIFQIWDKDTRHSQDRGRPLLGYAPLAPHRAHRVRRDPEPGSLHKNKESKKSGRGDISTLEIEDLLYSFEVKSS